MLENTKKWMDKAIRHLELEFSKIQAWRATPSMVEDIKVDAYWNLQVIKNLASITNIDNQTLSIKPWDKSIIHNIAKAITDAWIGLNPKTMADSVIIKVPETTLERRKELVKIAKKEAEEAKISIRNVRQDWLKEIKKAEENKEITKDDLIKLEKDLQKIVDEANKKVDELTKKKEADLMKI